MSERRFVHLHCHSHYSLLDGASSIDRLVERTKQHGMNALAITDHGNLHGALDFYKTAKAAGINPIIGYEAYIAPGSRFEKDAGSMKDSSYHLTLLAQNRAGFKNLIKLASAASLEGFYFKPRIDKALLEQFNEGIVCLSGCLSSEFNRAILAGRQGEDELKESTAVAEWFHRLFGDRYFIEIMSNGLDLQRIATEGAVSIANRLGIPLVATCDAHYIDQEDADAQDVLLCINTGKFRTDTQRMRMDGNQYYLKHPDEMYAAFPGLEEAVAQSQQIADSVHIDLELGKRHFPTYALPPEKNAGDYLRELCIAGLLERYAEDPSRCCNGQLSEVVMQRLDRELNCINKLGFANYFLIVWDFVRHARTQGIPATARGSGVGAIVCYALYLSHICPLKYELLFERFLDENRREAPDIDIDFCKDRRSDVIRYVKEKYGEANVAQIGTFGTLAARAAIKDVGRALGIALQRVNQITEMVPDELGISLDDALTKSDDLRKTYNSDPEIRELLDFARKIEGLARNVGTHAAAVVIADQPLTEYVPLGRVSGKTDIITQWAMGDVEAAGLLKMDFLGLRNLTILSKAVEMIELSQGIRVDPQKFPLTDPKTFELLRRGETKGVFQLESGGIRDLLQRMKPDHFNDIVATNALYRPGPLEGGMVDEYIAVKHRRQPAEYKHPVMKEVLEETNGVMVYQEQVMRILNKLGGIELADAYTCIKAISKKKEELIAKNYEQFIRGATERGMSETNAKDVWELIIKFAGYGFNKSHSAAYALIAFQTAYLKAHYPVEFMAALLSGDMEGRNFKRKDSLVEHLEDCARMGIEVVQPNINLCEADFAVRDGKILFGLAAIKGCGSSAAEAIAAARRQAGPFRDIFEFCNRVDSTQCGRMAIEALVKAGAFDPLGQKRSQTMAAVEKAISAGASAAADRKRGQKSLFGIGDDDIRLATPVRLPDLPEFPEREKLGYEKEVLGYYLTSHPLAEHEQTFKTFCTHTTADIANLPDRAEVYLGGMLSSIKLTHSKNAKPGAPTKYANFDFEDVDGAVRGILWPTDFVTYGHFIQPDAILVVRGSIERRGGDESTLIVNEIIPLEELGSRYTSGIVIRVEETDGGEQRLAQIREIVRGYPGNCELQLLLCLQDGTHVAIRSQRTRVEINAELRSRLDTALGTGQYRLITTRPKTSEPKRPFRKTPMQPV